MVDIAFGPEQGKRTDVTAPGDAYLAGNGKKLLYGGILMLFLGGNMDSGFVLWEDWKVGEVIDGCLF